MDEVDDILNQNQVVEEEEDEDDLTEEIAGVAEPTNANDEDGQDEDEEQDQNMEEEDEEEGDDDDDDDEDDDEIEDDDEDIDEDDDEDDEDEDGVNDGDMDGNTRNGTTSTNTTPDSESKRTSGYDKIHMYYTELARNARIASVYSITPSAAIPIQTQVHSITMSKGLKYLFLGGQDGYIRKFDFLNTIEGKLSLTILQKHSLVESISNAGILTSYWENEIPQLRKDMKLTKNGKEYEPKVSPVHALEVQSECLFVLAGQENGGITLQGVRYMEGQIGYYFKKHKSTVSLLMLNDSEDKFLSGSWDKQLLEWDLETGECVTEFKGASSQLSTLAYRPLFSTVEISSCRSDQINNSSDVKSDNGKEDDDMDSLFGDEDDDPLADKPKDKELTVDQSQQTDTAAPTPTQMLDSLDIIDKTTLRTKYNENVLLTSCIDGAIQVWDRRISTSPQITFPRHKLTPPWCMSACWSNDGDKVYAGRRSAIVEEYDLRKISQVSKTLRLPKISGPVSSVKALPNGRHILCASQDNIRLYDVNSSTSTPFLIVPGHHGGTISHLYVDPSCRFLISTSGNRGWQGNCTDITLIYHIDLE
ncbi:SAGA complex subunit SPT8 Ecym_1499 [Eremothecium cymbalariae DBVPG|uniref:Transcription factor spt8 beta-propeller domain-containing protein n=1 Tax=Eremothecium cymbalariae (strain CBS 270.75 / DBVPG 7215 / KCTC 17166 / NRRL Y-17582) TaxID=931890 RepID=G8JMQ8_ERECY|nr:hypothetical protein Ecym_1499 [Eremothecium cymbalariae DBVPG\